MFLRENQNLNARQIFSNQRENLNIGALAVNSERRREVVESDKKVKVLLSLKCDRINCQFIK